MPLTIGGLCPLLQVFDMPTSLRFYRDLLGFVERSPVPPDGRCDWVLLELNGSELMLNTAFEADDRPPVPETSRVKAHADTALFFDCPDLAAAVIHLRDAGVSISGPTVRDYGMEQLYFTDPDGYEICFQRPAR